MGNVYKGALCNIAATESDDSRWMFSQKRASNLALTGEGMVQPILQSREDLAQPHAATMAIAEHSQLPPSNLVLVQASSQLSIAHAASCDMSRQTTIKQAVSSPQESGPLIFESVFTSHQPPPCQEMAVVESLVFNEGHGENENMVGRKRRCIYYLKPEGALP